MRLLILILYLYIQTLADINNIFVIYLFCNIFIDIIYFNKAMFDNYLIFLVYITKI